MCRLEVAGSVCWFYNGMELMSVYPGVNLQRVYAQAACGSHRQNRN